MFAAGDLMMVALSDQKPETATSQQQAASTPQVEPGEQLSAALRDLQAFFSEITAYARYLLFLQIDRAKLVSKRIAFYSIAGLLGLVVLAAFMAVGTCLLLIGVAGWLGQAFNSFWIGATIVGLLMFILPALGMLFAWRYLNKAAIKSLRGKYAKIREEQKLDLGRDLKEAAHG
jgi:hypothetical protein